MRLYSTFAAYALFLTAAVITPIQGQNAGSPGVGFAMVGLAAGQTARVNVLNLAPSAAVNQLSCTATMQFLDSQGNVLKQSTTNLAPGSAALLDLTQAEAQGSGLRTEIRAVVLFGYTGGANPPAPLLETSGCSSLVPSVEIFDSSTGIGSLVLLSYRALTGPPDRPR